jgi:UV DNA damage endonuclease
MKIGYACLTTGLNQERYKTCIQKNATEETLTQLIAHNLKVLSLMLDYNIEHQIMMFRISSDLIPFGSSPVNQLSWWELFSEEFLALGEKIREHGLRVSMHPGQYTVINSPDQGVVGRAFLDLEYHARVLDSMGLNSEHKLILHIGGVYQEREQATQRFMDAYDQLSPEVKRRLVIENDDKSYTIEEVLRIGFLKNIPVVYDNLHNQVLPSDTNKDDVYYIKEAAKTWKRQDGPQKIHYSQQNPSKRPGSHSRTIYIRQFYEFFQQLKTSIPEQELPDIMLEVKDKNLSARKCILALDQTPKIRNLEEEWALYKYKILEQSHAHYLKIRRLLKDKTSYPVLEFYEILEEAMDLELEETKSLGNFLNSSEHIWGYYKKQVTEKERKEYLALLEAIQKGTKKKESLRNFLLKLTQKYQDPYLLNSYFFWYQE